MPWPVYLQEIAEVPTELGTVWGPRDDMGNFEKRKIVCSLPGFKLQTVQPIP